MIEANNRFLQRVNPEILRAKADGGASNNHPEIQRLMRQMVDLDIANDLKFWMHSGLVKERVSGSDVFAEKGYDISGEENDAVQTNISHQPELLNGVFEFDGSADRLTLPNDFGIFDGSQSFSLMAWFSVVENPNDSVGHILSFAGEHEVHFQSKSLQDGTPGLQLFEAGTGNSFVTYGTNVDGDGYHHIAAIYDTVNEDVYLLVDGNLVDSLGSLPIPRSRGDLNWLGARNTFQRYHHGEINDTRIINAALTEAQIQAIFNATKDNYQ